MTTFRTIAVLGLVALALCGCGRKNFPVALTPEGQPERPSAILPDAGGVARGPTITPPSSDLSVVPAEVTRNPNAAPRRFVLDGLLN